MLLSAPPLLLPPPLRRRPLLAAAAASSSPGFSGRWSQPAPGPADSARARSDPNAGGFDQSAHRPPVPRPSARKRRWSRDRESYLTDNDDALPLPMTYPDSTPVSPEEIDRRLRCDPQVEVRV